MCSSVLTRKSTEEIQALLAQHNAVTQLPTLTREELKIALVELGEGFDPKDKKPRLVQLPTAALANKSLGNLTDNEDDSENGGDGEEEGDDFGKDDGASEDYVAVGRAILKFYCNEDRRDSLPECKDVEDSEKLIDDASDRIVLLKLEMQGKARERAFQREEKKREGLFRGTLELMNYRF